MAAAQREAIGPGTTVEWYKHTAALVVLLVAAGAFVLLMDPDALPGPDTVIPALLGFAVVVVTICAVRRRLSLCYALTDAIDLPTWDFSTSWAANLTTIGAVFGTVLTSTLGLPAAPLLSKDAYTGLFLFFGGVVIVAGFFYTATRGADKTQAGVYHGYILTFLIACALTLWAVLGELWILLLLLFDLHTNGAAFTDTVFALFRLIIGATIALTVWYCWRTIGATIYWAVPPESPKPNAPAPRVPLTKPSSAALL